MRLGLTALLTFFSAPVLLTQEVQPNSAQAIVSGFAPFAGRKVNGSFVLAKAIESGHREFKAIEVPVIWGAPEQAWKLHGESAPFWLAFGEGTSVFQIEVKADNHRGKHVDNNGALPPKPLILDNAPMELRNHIPAEAIAESLTKKGFPTVVSTNAGNYLCEEMLFTLLAHQKGETGNCIFVHIPVLGHKVRMPDGSKQMVTREWLTEFGNALVGELASRKISHFVAFLPSP